MIFQDVNADELERELRKTTRKCSLLDRFVLGEKNAKRELKIGTTTSSRDRVLDKHKLNECRMLL